MRVLELFFSMHGPAAFVLVAVVAGCVVLYVVRRVVGDSERDAQLKAAREEIAELKRLIARPVVEHRISAPTEPME